MATSYTKNNLTMSDKIKDKFKPIVSEGPEESLLGEPLTQEISDIEEPSKDELDDGLGESAPFDEPPEHKKGDKSNPIVALITNSPDIIQQYQKLARDLLDQFSTRREVLEHQVDTLAECMHIASEIYRTFPIPDNAYQLASLTNAHNSSLNLLEKSRDPKVMLREIEELIKKMFTLVAQSLTIEVSRTKIEMLKLYPNDKVTVDDLFLRMFAAVSPESQKLYDDLQASLRKILGIKK